MKSILTYIAISIATSAVFIFSGCARQSAPDDPDSLVSTLSIFRESSISCTINGEEVEWKQEAGLYKHVILDSEWIDVLLEVDPLETDGERVHYELSESGSAFRDLGAAADYPDGYPLRLYKTTAVLRIGYKTD